MQSPPEARFTLLRMRTAGRRTRAEERYRLPLATAGKLYFPDNKDNVYAWVTNLSTTGVGLTLPMALEVGLELHLFLRSPGGKLMYKWPARVVHATRAADDSWRIGCT